MGGIYVTLLCFDYTSRRSRASLGVAERSSGSFTRLTTHSPARRHETNDGLCHLGAPLTH